MVIASLSCSSVVSRSFFRAARSSLSSFDALSSESSCRCSAATDCWWLALKRSFRSRLIRRSTDSGMEPRAKSLSAPTRNSSTPSAHGPSVSLRCDRPVTVPSSLRCTAFEVSMSPPPVQSRKSTYLGLPSDVVCSPAAARSHPVSSTAMSMSRPSASGIACSSASTCVSLFGSAAAVPRLIDVAW